MSTFALPDLGEGLQEAEIVSWHVAEGDHVVVDQPLVAVETEKAVVEVPSPRSGHVAKLLVKTGERVKVGAPLVEFEEGAHAETGTVVGELTAPTKSASAPRASPAVRARARELGVDLALVTPTGPDRTVLLSDVQAAVSRDSVGTTALRGARRTMAANMAQAWREVAHATLHDEADIEAWSAGEDVTCRLMRAVVAGCNEEPALNASYDAAAFSLRNNPAIDLGLAVDSSEGLFVPVLRDVAATAAAEWRTKIEFLKRGVEERSLTPASFRSPTITLSNFGSIAGRYASLIIMPPQVAILGAGRISLQPAQNTRPLDRAAPHPAIIPDLRSPSRHRRHGSTFPACRDRGSHVAFLAGANMEDTFRFSDAFGPSRIIHIYRPGLGLKAIVVVDNTACGPAIGGARMAPHVSLEECFRLARAMTWKNAAAGLPHGGGKSVIFGDPAMDVAAKEELIRSFAGALRDVTDYIPGPDMGTDERCMAWVKDETGRAVGLPSEIGGIPLDEIGATGFGLAACVDVAREFIGLDLQGARVAIQGFGAVGRHAARFLANKGAVLVAASDTGGTLIDPSGLDVGELTALKAAGANCATTTRVRSLPATRSSMSTARYGYRRRVPMWSAPTTCPGCERA